MSIETTGIYNLNRSTRAMDSMTRQLTTGKRVNAAQYDPSVWARASRSRAVVSHLQGINGGLNAVALSIKIADTTMGTINDYITEMKAQLETLVKNYPPFPPGSEERVKALRAFNAFRKQIDQLTFPPNDVGAMKIMADPALVPEAGEWDVLTGDCSSRITVQGEEVHTGPTGLNIPALPEDATNDEIYGALSNLDTAQDVLGQKRSGLKTDAQMIVRSITFNTDLVSFHRSYADTVESADMQEVTAEIKSLQLGYTISMESIKSLTSAQADLAGLLR